MTTQRLIQNFRRGRGLLWAGADFNAEALERSLTRLGVALVKVEQVDGAALDPERDIVFLDADQPFDPSPLLRPDIPLPAAPVIGLVGVEAPSRLKLLSEAGATAILRKPVQSAAVYSALFLGVNNYRRIWRAEARILAGERKRRGRRFLIKAIVALIETRGLGDDDAYAALRRESMRRRLDLEDFCEGLFAPGAEFPAVCPWAPAATVPDCNQGGANVEIDLTGNSPGGLDGALDGAGGRSDQARRA